MGGGELKQERDVNGSNLTKTGEREREREEKE